MMEEIWRIREGAIQKKELNELEIEFANKNGIEHSLLQMENLKIDSIAKSKLLQKI